MKTREFVQRFGCIPMDARMAEIMVKQYERIAKLEAALSEITEEYEAEIKYHLSGLADISHEDDCRHRDFHSDMKIIHKCKQLLEQD